MVRDNVTGLIWESKTDDGTIHNKDDTYTWNDPTDPYPVTPGVGTDTKYFIDALNSARFGGSSEWRMPTVKELGSIIDYSNPGLKSSIATNPSYLCAASRLTYDLKILIPDVLLSDGSTHLWVNLEYEPALSTDENAYFLVKSYAKRTPLPRH